MPPVAVKGRSPGQLGEIAWARIRRCSREFWLPQVWKATRKETARWLNSKPRLDWPLSEGKAGEILRRHPVEQAEVVTEAQTILSGWTTVQGFGRRRIDPAYPDGAAHPEIYAYRLLARLDFLRPLLQAFLLTGEGVWLEKLNRLLLEWSAARYKQRAWDTVDDSIRVLNLLEVIAILQVKLSPEAFRAGLETVLRCAWNVEIRRARAGNHLIYEALALLAAGKALQGHPRAGHWEETGLRILEREMARQVRPDGMNGELCTSYHLITGTNFLKGWVLAQNRDAELSLQYQRSLNRMSAVAEQLRASDGGFIALGDSDRIVGVCREEEEGRAFALLGSAHTSTLDLDWLLAGNDAGPFKSAAEGQSGVRGDFGGYHLRRSPAGGLLIFDAGPFGMPGASHHGHADSLAFEVHLPGVRFLVDPGGFSYVDFAARKFARSTAAHNTVRVDGRDSSQISGDFDYGRSAQAHCLGIHARHGGYLFCGEHDGYAPLTHRRVLLWIPGPPLRLIVFDKVAGPGSHSIEVFHHADAGWKARVEDGNRVVWQKDHHRVVQVAWCSQAGKVQLVQGQIEPQRQGWVSKSYGEYLEAPVLICQSAADLPVIIVNAFAEMSGDPQRISFDESGAVLTISSSEKFRWRWEGDMPEISREIVDGRQVIQ